MDRRTFLKGSAAFTGGALAADRFLFGGLTKVGAAEKAEAVGAVTASRGQLARNKKVVQRFFDEVVNERRLNRVDDLVAIGARSV